MKLSDFLPNRRDYTGYLAYFAVVFTAYFSTFIFIPSMLSSPNLPIFILIGILYIILGIFGESYAAKRGEIYLSLLYLCIQIALGITIIYMSRGAAWLALMPIASHSVTLLPRWGVFLIISVLLISWGIQNYLLSHSFQDFIPYFVSILAAIIFVVAFTQITVSEQNARLEVERLAEQLSQANQQLREYALRAEELAAAEERNRIAREIHDGLGHYLTALNMQLKASQAVFEQNPASALEFLSKAQTLAQEALADVRRSVSALRANPAGKKPLAEALRELVEESVSQNLKTSFKLSGQPYSLSPQAELALFRSAQEGLTNIHKHAQATQAEYLLDYSSNQVTLIITDNGIGMTKPGKGYGLLGLSERLHLLGGEVQTKTTPGHGFELIITLPKQA